MSGPVGSGNIFSVPDHDRVVSIEDNVAQLCACFNGRIANMEHAEDDRRNADCPHQVRFLHDVLRSQEPACVQSDIGRVHDGDPPLRLI